MRSTPPSEVPMDAQLPPPVAVGDRVAVTGILDDLVPLTADMTGTVLRVGT
ncbi:MAG: hypothetical protein WBC17_05630 [Mycobacterium sp.]